MELHGKLMELRSLIKTPNDVSYVLGFFGTKGDMYDSVFINTLSLNGRVHAFPKRIKGVDTSRIGFIKTSCYAYVRKDVRGGKVTVTPLDENDVKLQHAIGFAKIEHEDWMKYVVWSSSFLNPSPKSKISGMCSTLDVRTRKESACYELYASRHETSSSSSDVSSYVFDGVDDPDEVEVYLTDDGQFFEMVMKVNVYLYFRKARVVDFVPGQEYAIMVHPHISYISAVWCSEPQTKREYIGFRKRNADGTYEPYSDISSDNTMIFEELGMPIAILQ